MNIYLCDICGDFATRFVEGNDFRCATCQPERYTIRPITPPDVQVTVSPLSAELYVGAIPLAHWAYAKSNGIEPLPYACRYSAAHKGSFDLVEAVTVLFCGPVGDVPACQACADLYARLQAR